MVEEEYAIVVEIHDNWESVYEFPNVTHVALVIPGARPDISPPSRIQVCNHQSN